MHALSTLCVLMYAEIESSICEFRQSCSPGPSCKRNRHEQVADDDVDEEAKLTSRRARNRSALHDCMTVTLCCKLWSAMLSTLCCIYPSACKTSADS